MNHDVLGELHVLEHALQLAGEGGPTLCTKWEAGEHGEALRGGARPTPGCSPCFSFDSIDFSASTEALFPTRSLFAKSFL